MRIEVPSLSRGYGGGGIVRAKDENGNSGEKLAKSSRNGDVDVSDTLLAGSVESDTLDKGEAREWVKRTVYQVHPRRPIERVYHETEKYRVRNVHHRLVRFDLVS